MGHIAGADRLKTRNNTASKKEAAGLKDLPDVQIAAQTFTFRELAAATNNFRPESFLGEGGFGRVYKGRLPSGQVNCSQFSPYSYVGCIKLIFSCKC